MIVTILTPTYNRGKELTQLYHSLCEQTSYEFQWFLIDDGSTDDTKVIVEEFMKDAPFSIQYAYQPNGGKHRALNTGIAKIDSTLTFIVDSDDTLTKTAVELILLYEERYRKRENLCGFSFLRAFPDGVINGKEFAEEEFIGEYRQVRIRAKDTHSDKAEVFKTSCLKEFPFPEFEGEKFLGEDLVWVRMDRKYQMVYVNKAIYIGNYLANGLTNQRRIHNLKSPRGCMARAEEFMKPDIPFSNRMKAALQYVVYGKFAHYGAGQLLQETSQTGMVLLAMIPGTLLYIKWKHQYGSLDNKKQD